MIAALAETAAQVRAALRQAGFHLVDTTDALTPGLRVREVAGGVLVSWNTSGIFTAFADRQQQRHMRAIVQAAVAGVLAPLDQRVAELTEGGKVLVVSGRTEAGRGM